MKFPEDVPSLIYPSNHAVGSPESGQFLQLAATGMRQSACVSARRMLLVQTYPCIEHSHTNNMDISTTSYVVIAQVRCQMPPHATHLTVEAHYRIIQHDEGSSRINHKIAVSDTAGSNAVEIEETEYNPRRVTFPQIIPKSPVITGLKNPKFGMGNMITYTNQYPGLSPYDWDTNSVRFRLPLTDDYATAGTAASLLDTTVDITISVKSKGYSEVNSNAYDYYPVMYLAWYDVDDDGLGL